MVAPFLNWQIKWNLRELGHSRNQMWLTKTLRIVLAPTVPSSEWSHRMRGKRAHQTSLTFQRLRPREATPMLSLAPVKGSSPISSMLASNSPRRRTFKPFEAKIGYRWTRRTQSSKWETCTVETLHSRKELSKSRTLQCTLVILRRSWGIRFRSVELIMFGWVVKLLKKSWWHQIQSAPISNPLVPEVVLSPMLLKSS